MPTDVAILKTWLATTAAAAAGGATLCQAWVRPVVGGVRRVRVFSFIWVILAGLFALQISATPARAMPTAVLAPACAYTQNASAAASFTFLQPLANGSTLTSTFDTSLLSLVRVDVCGPAGGSVASVAQLSATSGSGAQLLRLDTINQQYIVNWSTLAPNVAIGNTYRITVQVTGLQLGAVDVAIVADSGAVSATPAASVAIVYGSTVPIKFRVAANPSPRLGQCARRAPPPARWQGR